MLVKNSRQLRSEVSCFLIHSPPLKKTKKKPTHKKPTTDSTFVHVCTGEYIECILHNIFNYTTGSDASSHAEIIFLFCSWMCYFVYRPGCFFFSAVKYEALEVYLNNTTSEILRQHPDWVVHITRHILIEAC